MPRVASGCGTSVVQQSEPAAPSGVGGAGDAAVPLAGHLPFDVDLVQGERWAQPSGPPIWPGIVDRRGHVVAGEPGRPRQSPPRRARARRRPCSRARRCRRRDPRPAAPWCRPAPHPRGHAIGRTRVSRRSRPAASRRPTVGDLLGATAGRRWRTRPPGDRAPRPGRAVGWPPPAGGCSRSRSVATRSGPGSAAARRLPPRRPTAPRTSRRGRSLARPDRRTPPRRGSTPCRGRDDRVGARLGCRGARWHGGSAHHRRCDRRAVGRAWAPKVTGVVGPTVVVGADAPVERRPRDRASGGGVRRTAGRDTGGRSAARLEGPGRRCGHRREPRIGAHRRKRRISSHRRSVGSAATDESVGSAATGCAAPATFDRGPSVDGVGSDGRGEWSAASTSDTTPPRMVTTRVSSAATAGRSAAATGGRSVTRDG